MREPFARRNRANPAKFGFGCGPEATVVACGQPLEWLHLPAWSRVPVLSPVRYRHSTPVARCVDMTPSSEVPPVSGSFGVVATGDWPETIRQMLPMMPRVLLSLRPSWSLAGIEMIDVDFLAEAGLRTLIWDVDGTLTHHHSCQLAAEAVTAFRQLREVEGLQHVIASNCGEQRFVSLSEVFRDVPIVKAYRAEDGPVARIRVNDDESWSSMPRGRLIPLRKPDPRVILAAVQALGISDYSSVAMVGDQHLTDVAAANLAGIRSIKVPTTGSAERPFMVRLLQAADAAAYFVMKLVPIRQTGAHQRR